MLFMMCMHFFSQCGLILLLIFSIYYMSHVWVVSYGVNFHDKTDRMCYCVIIVQLVFSSPVEQNKARKKYFQ